MRLLAHTLRPRHRPFLTTPRHNRLPFHKILLTNTSLLPSHNPTTRTTKTASAYLFPSSHYIPQIPLDPPSIETFIRAFLLPQTHHPSNNAHAKPHSDPAPLLLNPTLQSEFPGTRSVPELLILICGHGARDTRCGIFGPLLQQQFERTLPDLGITVQNSDTPSSHSRLPQARVGLISHIGGHKFAGNVIIYVPPSFLLSKAGKPSPLAGRAIWYGRVEPKHVEGIIKTTILEGRVISELFRGAVGKEETTLSL